MIPGGRNVIFPKSYINQNASEQAEREEEAESKCARPSWQLDTTLVNF